MVLHGRVENGAVVFSNGVSLPDGTEVTVIIQPVVESVPEQSSSTQQRVKLPLVKSKEPSSRPLTADRIAELAEVERLTQTN